ncbi:MAG: PHP domain-containing protein [Lachnospiraceae bacterium]|nr:PHP domain-containing protein [Lachnospiraceae bacterium]
MIEGNIRDGITDNRGVDLHVHSNRSDGTFTPSELVSYAVKKGLRAMALTDHDSIDGLKEIHEAASRTDNAPEIVDGVELSTDLDGHDIHIVGLFIDTDQPELNNYLQRFKDARDLRNEKMCRALHEGIGLDISYEKLKAAFPGSVITRAHYARYMLDHGAISSMEEAFVRYIGDGKPYFIPREKVTPFDGVELISKAKGIPVLAHPLLYGMSMEKLCKLISDLKAAGLKGMETRYSTYTSSDTRQMIHVAEKFDLLESGGSDFHGGNKKDIDLGVGKGSLHVPYEVYEKLLEYRNSL